MTLLEQIAALEAAIAARPHSGELLWDDYRKLAGLHRQRADALEKALRAVEYSEYIRAEALMGDWACTVCGKTQGYGHYPDCIIGMALYPDGPQSSASQSMPATAP